MLCYTALHLTRTLWWAWPEFDWRLSFSSPSTRTEQCTRLGGLWPDKMALQFGSSPWAGKKPSLLDSLGGLCPVTVREKSADSLISGLLVSDKRSATGLIPEAAL